MPSAVDSIAVVGEWIRHVPHQAAPLGRGSQPTSGRWQRGTTVRGLYLADDSATAVAEWYRWLAERGLPPSGGIPHDHHRWKVSVEVADLSTADRLAHVGLPLPEPSRLTWPQFQAVGERLWREGWAGVLAPCAARPSARILCLFADGWLPPGCRPVRIEEIGDVPIPPTGMTT